MDKRLHLVEPSLAVLACQYLWDVGEGDTAESVAAHVLVQRTTDPAFAELDAWLTQHQSQVAARTRPVRVIRHPGLARPDGRVNSNPYALN